MGKDFSGGEDFYFFSFFLCSHPTCSLQVPMRFLICSLGSQCVPQGCFQVVFGVESELSIIYFPCKFCFVFFLIVFLEGGGRSKQRVPNSTSFLSHMFWQMLSSQLGQRGRNSTLQNRTFYFVEPPQFISFERWGNQIGSSQKKKFEFETRFV